MANRKQASVGMTIIEIVVAMAVVGLLAALVLPAVFAARQATQRITCQSRLHDLGIALHGYADRSGMLPINHHTRTSFLARLLPDLERTALYDSINFSYGDPDSRAVPNRTAQATSVAAFLCPTYSRSHSTRVIDPKAPIEPGGFSATTTYLGTAGVGQWEGDNLEDIGPGVFFSNTRLAQIRDGLSKTAVIGEVLANAGSGNGNTTDPLAFVRIVRDTDSVERFVKKCAKSDWRGTMIGMPWLSPNYGDTLYTHWFVPGERSCRGGEEGNPKSIYFQAITSNSLHEDVVHQLRADGSVHPITRNVDRAVWRAQATMDGSD